MKTIAAIISIGLFLVCFPACAQQQPTGTPINVYTRSDACGAAQTWAAYMGDYFQEDLTGTAVYGDPGLAEAVIKDSLGIGYNNLNYAYDMTTGKPVMGLAIIPLDLDENGEIDSTEYFYANKNNLTKAIAEGHFPSPPARELNLVTHDSFKGLTREFIRWILTDGQQYVPEAGYINLNDKLINESLNFLGNDKGTVAYDGTITISGAWALYPMVVKWAEEFQRLHPDVNFDISAGGAGKGMADALGSLVDLGMVSREIYPQEVEKGAVWIPVTKDAVVPTANSENPYLDKLLAQGIGKQEFQDIWISGKITDWADIVK